VGPERGPLSLVSKIEELPERKRSGFGLESRKYGRGIRHAHHVAPSIGQKLALTSPTSGGRSVGVVRSRSQATDLVICFFFVLWHSSVHFRPLSII
jgi:hypothetical protein